MATSADITNYLAANPNASDSQIATAMQQNGVTPQQVAAATGGNTNGIITRYNAATGLSVNPGLDANAFAASQGYGSTGVGGSQIQYQWEQPGANMNKQGTYYGMGLQANDNTYLGSENNNVGQTRGFMPTDFNGLDPSITGARFDTRSGVAQNDNSTNQLVSSDGKLIANWGSGGPTGQPSSLGAGYSWDGSKIVADPSQTSERTFYQGQWLPIGQGGGTGPARAGGGAGGAPGQGGAGGNPSIMPAAGSYDATTRSVDPSELTSTQLNGLISANSPYIQQARSAARVGANDRGLINSSMAQGAGEAAAINAALPIAQANAGTYTGVLTGNMNAENTAAANNAQMRSTANIAGAQNATELQNTGLNNATQIKVTGMNNATALQQTGMNNQTTLSNTRMNNETSLQQTGMNNATQLQNTSMNNTTALQQTSLSTDAQKAIAQMNNATQVQVNDALNANRTLLQNSQAATNLANQYALNVANIDASTTMDLAAKTAAIQTQTQIFNSSVAALTTATPGVPDVSSQLTFGGTTTQTSPTPVANPQEYQVGGA